MRPAVMAGWTGGRPKGFWVEGWPLPMVVGVGGMDRWWPLQGVMTWSVAIDGVRGVGSGVHVHGI